MAVSLEQVLAALQQLLNMFKVERYLYLFGSVVGLLFSIYYTYFVITTENLNRADTLLLLGSSGVIATASFRISYMFNKSFDLIARLVGLPDTPRPTGVTTDIPHGGGGAST